MVMEILRQKLSLRLSCRSRNGRFGPPRLECSQRCFYEQELRRHRDNTLAQGELRQTGDGCLVKSRSSAIRAHLQQILPWPWCSLQLDKLSYSYTNTVAQTQLHKHSYTITTFSCNLHTANEADRGSSFDDKIGCIFSCAKGALCQFAII